MIDFYNLKNLPRLYAHRHVMQVSSFDRKEENGDFNQFLYEDKDGSMVLFDEVGRGCIMSFWSAVTFEESILRFYFDGEETPRYTCSLKGFFNGELKEFDTPANTFLERGHYDAADCRCGNCFIPIPYEKGLKITVTGKTEFYYHIMYERYDSDVCGELCDGVLSDSYERAFAGESPVRLPVNFETNVKLEGEYNNIFKRDTPGVITEFTVSTDADTDFSDVKLDIFCDDSLISQIACPLEHFFAMPLGFTEVHTLAVDTRIEDGRKVMSFYLPIPFWKNIGICFVNPKRDGTELKLSLRIEENDYDEASCGLLYGDYREGLTELYEDWLIGEFSGRGSVVGVVQTCHGGQYCEGNEHFYINGTLTPQINGTGTEDFYLGCYWPNLKYDSPVAGCVNDVYLMGGGTVKGAFNHTAGYYRFLHDMPISFENGIKLAIQHGAVGQTYSDYSSLCLSYRRPDASLEETDYINLSSPASMDLHSYSAEDAVPLELRAKVEADRKSPILSRCGFTHNGGKITFKAATVKGNRGCALRRLYDQRVSPQSARVYVNGSFAGVWHNPNFNDFAPFADSDFYLPAGLTAECDMLEITLECDGVFTDFEYKLLTAK